MPADVPHGAKLTAATAVLMAVWWMTEALPIPATALVPLVVFPVLNGDVGFDDVGASCGNNIIFLFMGGFILALAMQRWNLHKRIALAIIGMIRAARPPAGPRLHGRHRLRLHVGLEHGDRRDDAPDRACRCCCW